MAGLHHLKEAGHSGRVSVRATFLDARPELVKRLEFFNALYHAGLIASVSIEPAILSEGCGAVPTAKQEREALRREWHEAARWYVAQLREKPGERPVPLNGWATNAGPGAAISPSRRTARFTRVIVKTSPA